MSPIDFTYTIPFIQNFIVSMLCVMDDFAIYYYFCFIPGWLSYGQGKVGERVAFKVNYCFKKIYLLTLRERGR